MPSLIDAECHHKAPERPLVCHCAAGTCPRRCDYRKLDMKTSCFNECGDVFGQREGVCDIRTCLWEQHGLSWAANLFWQVSICSEEDLRNARHGNSTRS